MTSLLRGSKLYTLRDRLASLQTAAFRENLSTLCGAAALKLVADGFRGSHAPDGTPWEPLKSRKGKPLLDTGRLRSSFAVESTPGGFRIGTAVGYAGYHQYGTRARAVASRAARKSARGRFVGKNAKTAYLLRIRPHINVGITARPMLPGSQLPAAWQKAMSRALNAAVRQQLHPGKAAA